MHHRRTIFRRRRRYSGRWQALLLALAACLATAPAAVPQTIARAGHHALSLTEPDLHAD